MPGEKIVGAPSAQSQVLKSDIRDQRVKELLTLPSMDRRLQMLYDWIRQGAVEQADFLDLIKIVTRQAELQEVAKDLRKVVATYCRSHPSPNEQEKNFRELVSRLPGLTSKLEVTAGLKS